MSDNTTSVFWAAIGFLFLGWFVFNVRTCQQAQDANREQTRQEAIKAGLVEGEFGRWVKPAATPVEAQ